MNGYTKRTSNVESVQEVADAPLIEGCIAGLSSHWDVLYKRYHGLVRRVVAWPRWHLTPSEVEDCVQEVFMELVRALPGFRGEASLSTFLTRLAKNKCVSHIRRKTALKRAREDVGYALEERKGNHDEPVALAIDHAPRLDDQVVALEAAAELLKMLRTLSLDCQTILRLRYFDDLSYDEICSKQTLPLGTVCSRLKRCLDRLKKEMVH